MSTPARAERLALCDLFLEVGPDAPTLSGAWTTRDLAAHLVIRERRPDAALGILAKPFADHGESVRRTEARHPYAEIVERVRTGPPMWSPTRLDAVERVANTVEFFVHHEDVRRARDGWEPRQLDADLDADLTSAFRRMGKLLVRKAPVGIVAAPTTGPATGTTVVLKAGDPSVTLRGPIGELILFVYGRQAHSRVEVTGDDDHVEAIRTARFGI
jgi:uncharacterized protein (TIGR03085 family)